MAGSNQLCRHVCYDLRDCPADFQVVGWPGALEYHWLVRGALPPERNCSGHLCCDAIIACRQHLG